MDYSKLKVTELKEELKKRGIPSTKLTRKQDIIDRLEEEDGKETEQEPVEDAQADEEPATKNDVAASAVTATETDQRSSEGTTNGAVTDAVQDSAAGETLTDTVAPNSTTAPIEDDPPALPAAKTPAPAVEEPVTTTLTAPSTIDVPLDPSEPIPSAEPVSEYLAPESTHPAPTTPLESSVEAAPEDSRKRKRRSLTPPVSQESVNKKLKETDKDIVHLKHEEVIADAPVAVNGKRSVDTDTGSRNEGIVDATILPMAPSDDFMDITTDETAKNTGVSSPKALKSPNERRFKDLFPTSAQDSTTDPEPMQEDVSVSPALHPATAAIYIRDLVRPINPDALQEHLGHIATPPGSEPTDVVTTVHVDSLRSHAFALFTSISAASRARAALHARVWPPEPTRRPLWVDFIPEEKLQQWIDLELSKRASRPSQAKRWEVVYTPSDSGITAELVDAASIPSRTITGPVGAPTGPRASNPTTAPAPTKEVRAPSQPIVTRIAPESNPSFLELDKLFQSTTTKPKLYYLAVSPDLVDKRLDELARQTSRDWNPREDARRNRDSLGRGLDQLKRYTFEDGDVLVDGGPEFGGGRAFRDDRGGGGYRGGRGGYGGRGRGDRYRYP